MVVGRALDIVAAVRQQQELAGIAGGVFVQDSRVMPEPEPKVSPNRSRSVAGSWPLATRP